VKRQPTDSTSNRACSSRNPRPFYGAEDVNATPNPSISQEKRTTIRLDIDKSLEIDPIKQYRERVRSYLADRKLSPVEKIRLKQFKEQLGLSQIEADRILEEEFAPIQRSQQNYRDVLNELIEGGHYPFNETIQDELKQCQQEENLTDKEVDEISNPILEAAEKLRQQQEFEAKLQRFEFEVITVNSKGKAISRSRKAAEVVAEDLGNGIKLEIVKIPGGTFMMGTEDAEIERLVKKIEWDGYRREKPQHQVKVLPFFMGKYPVTQAQWKAIAQRTELKVERDLKPAPSNFKGDARPVEQVSWYDAVEFCTRLSRLTKREISTRNYASRSISMQCLWFVRHARSAMGMVRR
jgi:hypothetical protein